jgi:hypothetical protein
MTSTSTNKRKRIQCNSNSIMAINDKRIEDKKEERERPEEATSTVQSVDSMPDLEERVQMDSTDDSSNGSRTEVEAGNTYNTGRFEETGSEETMNRRQRQQQDLGILIIQWSDDFDPSTVDDNPERRIESVRLANSSLRPNSGLEQHRDDGNNKKD